MKKSILVVLFFYAMIFMSTESEAQVGYYDAPYTRYEANLGTLNNATVTSKSYNQGTIQSEASDQICVNLSNSGASVAWNLTAEGDGLVVRYSVPDGQSGVLEVYANGTFVGTMNLTSYYSWEYLWSNGNPNNVGVVNTNPKMRFDEVRMKLPSKIPVGGNLRLVRQSGNIHIDFAELESVPAAVTSSAGNLYYSGNGSDLQTVIDNNGGATIYLPPGIYYVNRELYFGVNNTSLKGAGLWYTQIHFTNGNGGQGGLRANAYNISYSGLYLTTDRNSRTNSYNAINGVYTGGSRITNIWAEHFECGAWIAQYNIGPANSDGLIISNCRFRNNYADGTNLCKGTVNSIVEHCSYRNNGDDDMAIWSANGQECSNNTFRYNTSENCWRASGCAIYGGYSNKAYNLLIKDNLEVGLRVNNNFPGVGFNGGGMHEFSNITIISCGTNNDLFYSPVGAIDILCNDVAGNRINNVKFSCISIIDSKNDAIYINRKNSGQGFYNLVFENITINGTGREFPDNDASGSGGTRGYAVLFKGSPSGNGTYCNMFYTNRGGNAPTDINTSNIGSFSWTQAGTCPGGCSLTSTTTITSASTFGICTNPIALTATSTPPTGNTVNYIEFFVDGSSIGTDNSSPYSLLWNNPTIGNHTVMAVAHFSGGTTSSSSNQSLTVADAVYATSPSPTIDGTIETLWNSFTTNTLNKVSVGSISGANDLSATFKLTRDASNLYVLINVTDDVLRNDGGFNWQKDAVELFIDMGNDKSTSYGANDFQYNFVYNISTVYETQHNATTGVIVAQGTKPGGYIMEVKIPWTTLGGAPAAGSFIGFDLHIDDNDTGTRDAKLAWNDGTDNAWQDPSLFGTFQISSCSNPLPIELISFSGIFKDGSSVLSWTTTSELNNEKFIIERSVDFSEWQNIGEVAGAGNSVSLLNYSFTDYNITEDLYYYRLRQINFDGSYTYSNVEVVKTGILTLSITPSPFTNELTITSKMYGPIDVSIRDMSGRLLYHSQQESFNGILIINPDLSPGAYLISIQSEAFVSQKKIIKN